MFKIGDPIIIGNQHAEEYAYAGIVGQVAIVVEYSGGGLNVQLKEGRYSGTWYSWFILEADALPIQTNHQAAFLLHSEGGGES